MVPQTGSLACDIGAGYVCEEFGDFAQAGQVGLRAGLRCGPGVELEFDDSVGGWLGCRELVKHREGASVVQCVGWI
jgi:hypothetical protein